MSLVKPHVPRPRRGHVSVCEAVFPKQAGTVIRRGHLICDGTHFVLNHFQSMPGSSGRLGVSVLMRFLRPFVDARSEIGGFEECQRSWLGWLASKWTACDAWAVWAAGEQK
jgi:hypothetical protein